MNYYIIPGLKDFKTVGSMDDICDLVCERYGVTLPQLKGKCRKQELVTARHLIIYLSRKFYNTRFVTLGQYFNRDHTTAIHAINRINEMIYTKDPLITDSLKEIESLFVFTRKLKRA